MTDRITVIKITWNKDTTEYRLSVAGDPIHIDSLGILFVEALKEVQQIVARDGETKDGKIYRDFQEETTPETLN